MVIPPLQYQITEALIVAWFSTCTMFFNFESNIWSTFDDWIKLWIKRKHFHVRKFVKFLKKLFRLVRDSIPVFFQTVWNSMKGRAIVEYNIWVFIMLMLWIMSVLKCSFDESISPLSTILIVIFRIFHSDEVCIFIFIAFIYKRSEELNERLIEKTLESMQPIVCIWHICIYPNNWIHLSVFHTVFIILFEYEWNMCLDGFVFFLNKCIKDYKNR